jgi:FkbM family methyltransferase
MNRVSNLIFDVGLHKGEDTDFYLKKGFNVVAFEANPSLVAECKSRFASELASGRLRIVEGAIADRGAGERLAFFCNRQTSVWGTIMPDWAARNERAGAPSDVIEVPRVDIRDAFNRFGIPYYLKIDVEGVDRLILQTLREFSERPEHVSIESEKVDFSQLQSELQQLRDLGYRAFRVVQQRTIPGSRISTTDISGRPFEHVFEMHSSGPFGDDLKSHSLSYSECLARYRRIFLAYRILGDNSPISRIKGARRVIRQLETQTGLSLPGWYDTHATLGADTSSPTLDCLPAA